MSRKVYRVPVHLDPKGIRQLSQDDVKAILRAAEDLIFRGGRTLLAKVLKGSRAKKVLEFMLTKNPAYGFYKNLTEPEILARIDWMILNDLLAIEYDYRLPLLVFTDRGWEIEKAAFATELLQGFDAMLAAAKRPFEMSYLKDRDRGMILLLLDKVEATGDPNYIPLLEAWAEVDYRKVKQRIRQVISRLA